MTENLHIKSALMDRISPLVDHLKSPYLVADIQNYFGVYRRGCSCPQQQNGEVPNLISNHVMPLDKMNGPTSLANKQCQQNQNCASSCAQKLQESTCNMTCASCVVHRHRRNSSTTSPYASLSETDHCNGPSDSDSDSTGSVKKSSSVAQKEYIIRNKLWYYVFSFGAGLGYEIFYSSFFPFWFWNIDGAVCRRVILVWVLIMYVGQALKDVICWPRPAAPPVVHLEPEYVHEYGMPSTHAMVGAAVPFSLLIFTMHRYEYPFIVGVFLATVWCVLVCVSRLYMGMHTVLDILGGLSLVAILMVGVIPLVDTVDHFQLTYPYAPLVIIGTALLMVMCYPQSDHWSPSRGDTTVILGTGAGVSLGSWLNYYLGMIRGPGLPPPYKILWPDYGVVGLALLRAIIGIMCIVAVRAFFKSATYAVVCHVLRMNSRDQSTKYHRSVEVPSKFLTYLAIGFTVTYTAPFVFRFLNIERITMFTEV